MVEESGEVVYDIGYGYGYNNPCRYLQQVFRSFLRCLGLEKQGEGKDRNTSGGVGGGDSGSSGRGGGEGGGDGDRGGGEVDDPPTTSPIMDPTDEPVFETMLLAQGVTRRRPPPRRPISSGGPGQTN